MKVSNDLKSMSREAVLAKFKVLSKLKKNSKYDLRVV